MMKRAILQFLIVVVIIEQFFIVVVTAQDDQCLVPKKVAPKEVYRVGVLANRGNETAMTQLGPTFTDYLTASAGRLFDPPIKFETVPVAFNRILDSLHLFDFVHANPSVFSCIESEVGAMSLVSQIAQRKVNSQVYNLTQFGGIIFTKADNEEINSIHDLKGKRIAAVAVTGLGTGQMQFREMQSAGLNHFQDPKQLLFARTMINVVNAVLLGQADVGFVRADQMARSTDPTTGEPLDLATIKIIGGRTEQSVTGEPFPFLTSTRLYPEWNLASLTHVPDQVAQAVQSAMLSLASHATIAPDLIACYENCSSMINSTYCRDVCFGNADPNLYGSCDTTPEIAIAAHEAISKGTYAGWRSTLPYMELRNMQEEINFIYHDEETNKIRCVRSSTVAEAIICPPGHFKKSDEEIENGCEEMGLSCHGYQCLCSPCQKKFYVDFFPLSEHKGNQTVEGCDKFSICGFVKQSSTITFHAVDNRVRRNAVFSVNVTIGRNVETYEMVRVADSSNSVTHELVFDATGCKVGVLIVEVYADGVQIDESPFRMEVLERDCEEEFGDRHVANPWGQCVCKSSAIDIGGTCFSLALLLPSAVLVLAVMILLAAHYYVQEKRKQADSIWMVEPEELLFKDPPTVLGKGTFGLVLLAEYRGTEVAVKRALPPKEVNRASNSRSRKVSSDDVEEAPTENEMPSPAARALLKREQRIKEAKVEMPRPESAVDNADPSSLRNRLHQYLGRSSSGVSGSSNSSPETDEAQFWTLYNAPDLQSNGRKSYFDFDATKSRDFSSISKSGSLDDDFGLQTGMFVDESILGIEMSGGKSKSKSGSRSGGRGLFSQSQYSKLRSNFIEEMRTLSKLRHPCVTTVMGAVLSSKSEPMLVLEYMELGSLYDLLHNDSMVVDVELVLPILRDIAQGVRFLHAANPTVIHGDLKAQNVLVDSKFRAKVADFGLSQKKKDKNHVTGTPLWLSPELLRRETCNTTQSDIYAFGIILYEVFSRKDPYEGENHMEVLRQVADPNINKRPPIPPACPPQVASIMELCLRGPPEERPTAQEVDVGLKLCHLEDSTPIEYMVSRRRQKFEQNEKTEDLLFQIFPQHVATALRDGHKVAPEKFDCVTVCFFDIVGYTSIAARLTPEKVSDLLDRLYTRFDTLCEQHDIFKVETVGDAYMTVTNLAKPQSDHVRRMTCFAFDSIEGASLTPIDVDDAAKGFVKIRCGFHSGPVVATVCGSRSPRYTMIGDTVNTASRMESSSAAGRVQCSVESAGFLMDCKDVKLKSRGVHHVKGKGEMQTFWVVPRTILAHNEGSAVRLESVVEEDDDHTMSEHDKSNTSLSVSSTSVDSKSRSSRSRSLGSAGRASRSSSRKR